MAIGTISDAARHQRLSRWVYAGFKPYSSRCRYEHFTSQLFLVDFDSRKQEVCGTKRLTHGHVFEIRWP